VYDYWSRTLVDTCRKTSSGRSWRVWASVSMQSCSSARAAVTRRPPKTTPNPSLYCHGSAGSEVAKVRSLTELCGLLVSVETYVAPKGLLQCKRCERFGHTQRYCGYATRCVACGEAHLSGECSTPQQQLKCCSCGGNRTANYRGCAKWKEAKAALAKRAPFVRSKVGSAPRPPVASKAQRSEPTAKQERLGQGWNHVVRGGRVIKVASLPTPKLAPSPVTPSPTRNVVESTGKKGKTAKSTPKVKVGPK